MTLYQYSIYNLVTQQMSPLFGKTCLEDAYRQFCHFIHHLPPTDRPCDYQLLLVGKLTISDPSDDYYNPTTGSVVAIPRFDSVPYIALESNGVIVMMYGDHDDVTELVSRMAAADAKRAAVASGDISAVS